MRKYLLKFIGLAAIVATIYSCKLDKPILPGQPGYVYVSPPDSSGTGTGTNIDSSLLTGTWKVITTNSIQYIDGVANTSVSPITLFTYVQIDNGLKTAFFGGAFVISDTTTYTLSTSGNKALMQLSADPFARSSNGPVQIQSLTATTMTWLAIDPIKITTQGHTLQSAWQIIYTRQ